MSIGCPCEYDLEEMDEYSLQMNLQMAYENKSGYVTYGGYRADVTSSTDLGDLSRTVKGSGATSLTAYDSNGTILTQMAITYSNSLYTTMIMKIRTNDMLTKTLDMKPMMGMGDETNIIPFTSEFDATGDTITMSFTMPWLLMEVGNSSDYDLILDFDVEYSKSMQMSVVSSTVMHQEGSSFSCMGNIDSISNSQYMRPGTSGTIGACAYTVDYSRTLSIISTEGSVSSYLRGAAATGGLIITDSNGFDYSMSAEQVKALAEALAVLEGSN